MVYTKTGDGGTTSLVGGTRVGKDDPRVEAYGTLDELSSHLALLAELLKESMATDYRLLKQQQNNLFAVQTLLATEDTDIYSRLPRLTGQETSQLEQRIDHIQAMLTPLKNFVIAGGSVANAQCHICRTVCRRAERGIVHLSHYAPIEQDIMCYINRLSDYLFVLSRSITQQQGISDDIYVPPKSKI